jgi:hypothetical protein
MTAIIHVNWKVLERTSAMLKAHAWSWSSPSSMIEGGRGEASNELASPSVAPSISVSIDTKRCSAARMPRISERCETGVRGRDSSVKLRAKFDFSELSEILQLRAQVSSADLALPWFDPSFD